MRIFVLGATGDQGQPLVDRLLADGHQVTAGARDPGRIAPANGLSAVTADIQQPDMLTAAMRGHDALCLHLPFVHDRGRAAALGQAVAEAVRAAGVPRIVFNTSCFVADHDLGLPAHDGRRAIEAALEASGANFTSIRPMVFMDNLARPWAKPSIVARGVFAYPAAPQLLISWVCIADIAAAMGAAVVRDDLRGARIALGGPEALVGDEVAERLTIAAGRPVRFVSLDPQTFAEDMAELVTGARIVPPGSVYHGMARFYAWYNAQPRSPLMVDANPLGLRLTSFAEWAAAQDWRAAARPDQNDREKLISTLRGAPTNTSPEA